MNIELYFLRSSESKIVADMVQYAYSKETDNLQIYTNNYGLTSKDLGLYALVDNIIAGAIWLREINDIPMLSLAVLPEFRNKGIASQMMEQFLLEAAELYTNIHVTCNKETVGFYEKFSFVKNADSNTMTKALIKKEVIRPTDGYDPTRWMD